MNNQMFTSVVLDVPRKIRFSNLALYRVGNLDSPRALGDLNNRRRSYTAMIQWLWACLIDDDAKAFATPEDLVEFVPTEKVDAVWDALLQCINLANPKTEKNGNSSTSAPSGTSS